MNHLKPLVMMQLKDKLDFSNFKSKGKAIAKIIFTVLGFVAVAAVSYVLFYFANLYNLFTVLPMIPTTIITLVFTIMFILSSIGCSFGLMKTLYLSSDNQVLLTLPVKPNLVFVSKLIVYYIYELIKNCYFMLPVLLSYGLFNGFSILYYPWLLVCFLLFSLAPVLIGAVISIPLMYIVSFLKQTKVIQTVLYTALIALVVYGVVFVISLIPENINLVANWGKISNSINDFLKNFSKTFYPFQLVIQMICGEYVNLAWQLFSIETLYIFLSLIGINGVLFLISFLLSRPLFFKMASSPFEYKKKLIKKTYLNNKKGVLTTSLSKEFKTSFRESKFIYNYGSVMIVLPIAILLLNKIFNAMSTDLQGLYMVYSFNLLMIMLILLSSNSMIASIYSGEGRSAYIMKTMPHKYSKYLFPKLVVPIALSLLSTIATTVIFAYFSGTNLINSTLMFLAVFGFYVGHLFWSAEMDLMNPQNEQYATTGEVNDNPNEKKSTVLAFIISFLVFGLSLFFFMEKATYTWLKLAAIGLVFSIARITFYFSKIKIYYGEK